MIGHVMLSNMKAVYLTIKIIMVVVRPFSDCTLWFDQTIISILVSMY